MLCRGYCEQIERVDRLLAIVYSTNPGPLIGEVECDDLIQFTIQAMWHVKDWILNDPSLSNDAKKNINHEVHSRRCLLICGDLANGTKHMSQRGNKTGFSYAGQTGVHLDGKQGISMRYYEIHSDEPTDPYHLMEIRDLLAECRKAWEEIGEAVDKAIVGDYMKELARTSA